MCERGLNKMTIRIRILLTLIPSAVFITAISAAVLASWLAGPALYLGVALVSALALAALVPLLLPWWLRPLQALAADPAASADDPMLRPLAGRLTGEADKLERLGREVQRLSSDLSITASAIFASMEKAEDSIARQQQENGHSVHGATGSSGDYAAAQHISVAPSVEDKKPATNTLGLTKSDYKGGPSTMCKGCGHDRISEAIIQASYDLGLDAKNILKMSGIGCSSKTPAYFLGNAMGLNSTHGRMPSFATGAHIANTSMTP
jgi:hypothetical protein